MMKTRNIENKLALIGALIVIIGVSSAATSALAAEPTDERTTNVVAKRSESASVTISGAREANAKTAAEAAEALKAETTLDLDIQLGDLTSTLIAGAK